MVMGIAGSRGAWFRGSCWCWRSGCSAARPRRVGGVLWTVNIPVRLSVDGGMQEQRKRSRRVPGGKLNFPKFQSLLVTSCVVSGQAKLFFLDPSTNPATLSRPLTPLSRRPPAGNRWRCVPTRSTSSAAGCVGLAEGLLDRLQQDRPQHPVDGTATLLYTGPAGSTCKGLAWTRRDPKTIYQSSSGASPIVLHLSETGPPIAGGAFLGLRRSHDRCGGRRGQRGDAGVLRLRPVRYVPGAVSVEPPRLRSARSREPTAPW